MSPISNDRNGLPENRDLLPDLEWLTESREVDASWPGPGPMLVNLNVWMEQLASVGPWYLVAATYAAVHQARQHWDAWLRESPEIALESLVDSQPPTRQLEAVAKWLATPSDQHKQRALDTVDLTKQLHWFHEEYGDVWFDEPGMWAAESSEFCVLSLTGDPYSSMSTSTLATISVACAINSFRRTIKDDVRQPISVILAAVDQQFEHLPR